MMGRYLIIILDCSACKTDSDSRVDEPHFLGDITFAFFDDVTFIGDDCIPLNHIDLFLVLFVCGIRRNQYLQTSTCSSIQCHLFIWTVE